MTNFIQPKDLPNASTVLALGIISIIFSGVIGFACAAIAIQTFNGDEIKYNYSPTLYSKTSWENLKAGRICAYIGLGLSSLVLMLLGVYFTIFSAIIYAVLKHLH